MTKTYSEQAQAVLFKASREMRKVAATVLDDVTNEVELLSEDTHRWAKDTARLYAERANELEIQGHGLTVASRRAETELFKARQVYYRSIDAYEKRRRSVEGQVVGTA